MGTHDSILRKIQEWKFGEVEGCRFTVEGLGLSLRRSQLTARPRRLGAGLKCWVPEFSRLGVCPRYHLGHLPPKRSCAKGWVGGPDSTNHFAGKYGEQEPYRRDTGSPPILYSTLL